MGRRAAPPSCRAEVVVVAAGAELVCGEFLPERREDRHRPLRGEGLPCDHPPPRRPTPARLGHSSRRSRRRSNAARESPRVAARRRRRPPRVPADPPAARPAAPSPPPAVRSVPSSAHSGELEAGGRVHGNQSWWTARRKITWSGLSVLFIVLGLSPAPSSSSTSPCTRRAGRPRASPARAREGPASSCRSLSHGSRSAWSGLPSGFGPCSRACPRRSSPRRRRR